MFLAGEWVPSNLLFSIAFLVAGGGCLALGWYVLRGDRANRRVIDTQAGADLVATAGGEHGHEATPMAERTTTETTPPPAAH